VSDQHGGRHTFLVFGVTGQTGRHFVSRALEQGHRVRVLVRDPAKLAVDGPNVEVHQGSITDDPNLDELVRGVDFVVSMLGDADLQKDNKINTAFVRALIPAMRRQGVTRFLYQAGGLSTPPNRRPSPVMWAIRNTVARKFVGQHKDNEAVMRYLMDEAHDIEWVVHRAGIGSDGPSKGVLHRSEKRLSIATFADCAAYNLRTVMDPTAIHTCDLSAYRRN
jgi:nucleoside-diphosphate-sugar epimerase